jgi:hypothetical protein
VDSACAIHQTNAEAKSARKAAKKAQEAAVLAERKAAVEAGVNAIKVKALFIANTTESLTKGQAKANAKKEEEKARSETKMAKALEKKLAQAEEDARAAAMHSSTITVEECIAAARATVLQEHEVKMAACASSKARDADIKETKRLKALEDALMLVATLTAEYDAANTKPTYKNRNDLDRIRHELDLAKSKVKRLTVAEFNRAVDTLTDV